MALSGCVMFCYSWHIMRRALLLLAMSGVLASSSLPAGAQKFQPKNIQFSGDAEYSDDELLAASGLKKGSVITVAEMKDHFERLRDSGVFETVLYKFDGQDLIFQLSPAAQLYRIRIGNLPLTPGKELDDQLHARLPLYHGKVPSEGGLLDGVRHALEDLLAVQGIHATVTATPFGTPGTKDVSAMNFSIASPPVVVGAVQLQGVSPELQAKLKAVVDHAVGSPFDTENSAQNLEHAFENFYLDEGYASAKVNASRSGDLKIAADSIGVPFSLTIQEGRTYKLGTVHLSTYSVVTQADLDKALASFGQAQVRIKGLTLRSIWAFIASSYKAKGYLDCNVTPLPEFDEASGTANYTVNVDPGPVYHLAYVKFENVSDDLRRLLMRNWQMLPGDIFDPGYVANFILNAQKADPVLQRSLSGVKAHFDVLADPQTHTVNVVIQFERAS